VHKPEALVVAGEEAFSVGGSDQLE